MKIQNIPNILSISRIVFSVLLLSVFENFTIFILLYVFAGITDILDGYVARKLKAESTLGAKIDSAADLFFYLVLTIYIVVQYTEVVIHFWILISIIFLLRFSGIIIGIYKFRKVVMIHTIGNKVAGFLIFLLPLFLWLKLEQAIPFILVIAQIASMEEILILIISKKGEIQLNKKSIFCLTNTNCRTDDI